MGDQSKMSSRHEKLVLVLLSAVASTVLFVSGCAGVTEPLPALAVAPESLTVSTKVGSASALPVTLTNTGAAPISVSRATLAGTGFSMNGLSMPVSLAAGQSTSFSVKFVASKAGTVNGSVAFVTDAVHRPVMLPLHGNGSTSTPEVSSIIVSPAVAAPAPSAHVQFTAAIEGTTTNVGVTWTASIGSISTAGVFTAPAAGGRGVITATSIADPTKSATATVTVSGASTQSSGSGVTGLTIFPSPASSITRGTLSFTGYGARYRNQQGCDLESVARHHQRERRLYRAGEGRDRYGDRDERRRSDKIGQRDGDGNNGRGGNRKLDRSLASVDERGNQRQSHIHGNGSGHDRRQERNLERGARYHHGVRSLHGASEGRYRHGHCDERCRDEQECVRQGNGHSARVSTKPAEQPAPSVQRVVQRLELRGIPRSTGRWRGVGRWARRRGNRSYEYK